MSIGHNSGETVASAELRQIIERIERLEEEKKAIQGDIKDVYGEFISIAVTTPKRSAKSSPVENAMLMNSPKRK
jgi:hypothetical protein